MSAPNPTTTTTIGPHTALTHALEHLRHALRCAGRALPDLGECTPAALRGAELCADVSAAARACANLLDHLDGYADGAQGHPARTLP
ncbi:hypothetical protein [Mycobacterium nebraskense]|uniref:Uncharacterized protein n=1 Tax=Mycobacterium nebraskense TaxID=244292 RepID=A0A1X1ZGP6_9MYCO|nr:hypothetical protein [Mycobacterium nebraskense]MBI2696162.1 hypothetical protein [Mycobacterium nebraskense]MCV7120334.1 hypothetical protein [Mycobacterium nebraskense]ORW22311.1 hypothetical protein AWC17_05215 [Mycobacterium nebraskense]